MDLELQRPDYVDDDSWQNIAAHHERLIRAVDAEDRPQAIGSLKDLMETIAKVILTLRGEVIERAAKFPQVVVRAQEVIERRPGHGAAEAEPLRSISQSVLTIAIRLGELRNDVGTGHGRAVQPSIESEIYAVGLEAGVIWCRWSMARLSALAFGLPDPLIQDLSRSTFYRGDLAARLEAVRLNELDPVHQRRLGVAVGRRAMRETFLVRDEGVRPCSESHDVDAWPSQYRIGLLNGLFFSEKEQLTLDEWMAGTAAGVVAPVPDLLGHLVDLRKKVGHEENPLQGFSFDHAWEIYERLKAGGTQLEEPARSVWISIAIHFNPAPF